MAPHLIPVLLYDVYIGRGEKSPCTIFFNKFEGKRAKDFYCPKHTNHQLMSYVLMFELSDKGNWTFPNPTVFLCPSVIVVAVVVKYID